MESLIGTGTVEAEGTLAEGYQARKAESLDVTPAEKKNALDVKRRKLAAGADEVLEEMTSMRTELLRL